MKNSQFSLTYLLWFPVYGSDNPVPAIRQMMSDYQKRGGWWTTCFILSFATLRSNFGGRMFKISFHRPAALLNFHMPWLLTELWTWSHDASTDQGCNSWELRQRNYSNLTQTPSNICLQRGREIVPLQYTKPSGSCFCQSLLIECT